MSRTVHRNAMRFGEVSEAKESPGAFSFANERRWLWPMSCRPCQIDAAFSKNSDSPFSLWGMKPQEKTFIVAGASAVLIAAGLGGSYLFFSKDNSSAANHATTTPTTTTPNTAATSGNTDTTGTTTNNTSATPAQTASSGYKDGTYSATTQYRVPRGSNNIDVSVTVKDGIVTAVKASHDYNDRESGMYIDSFESTLQSAVAGKSLDGLQLNRIGGATLTTVAFDDAIASIQNDAKA